MRTLPLLLALGLLPAAVGSASAQALLDSLASPNAQASGFFGLSAASVPDLDGDGTDDLFVGATDESVLDGTGTVVEDAGRAYVFSGASGAVLHTLQSPNPEEEGAFGNPVEWVPDTDGDAVADLLVDAFYEDVPDLRDGRVYLFSGATGQLLRSFVSTDTAPESGFGSALAGLGDVDGDGRGEVVARSGEDYAGQENAGVVYVFNGATGALLRRFGSPNPEKNGSFGGGVAAVADLDGDGVDDLLVGAVNENPGGSPHNAGRAYVFSGATGALVRELASPNEEEGGSFGAPVSGVGDLDGDGVGDLVVGASQESTATAGVAGRVYVFSGATGALLHTLASPNDEFQGTFGASVSGVSDVDVDGVGELLVGANAEDPGGSPEDAGRAYVFSGATGALLYELASPNEEEDGSFGNAVSGLGDVDGDGHGDLLVSAPIEDLGTDLTAAGRVYLFSGGTGGALSVEAEPVSPPIVIPPGGGTFTYTVTTTNATSETQTVQLWTRVTRADGQQTRALRGPVTRTLTPGESLTDELRQSVPGGIAAGVYTYTAYVGTFPRDVLASDGFTFTKQGAALAGGEGDDDVLWQEAAASESPAEASAAGEVPEVFALHAARPNPFAGRTTLAFDLPEAGPVRLSVYDVLGREVARLVDGSLPAGRHEAVLDGARLPVGTYLVRLEAGSFVQAQRLTLLR